MKCLSFTVFKILLCDFKALVKVSVLLALDCV